MDSRRSTLWKGAIVMPDNDPVSLSEEARTKLVQEKVTCPFLGPVVAARQLAVHQNETDPLASIEEVRALGNSGGGDLGDLLVLFAQGNHAHMRGSSGTGKLSEKVPAGFFSLNLPGSQGSHAGHSGILQGSPTDIDSGGFSAVDWQRLLDRAQDGYITRSAVAAFIAENLVNDPLAKVFGGSVVGVLAHDLHSFVSTIGPAILARLRGTREEAVSAHRSVLEKYTSVLGADNLVGSAGEFGLLFALLAHQPGARRIDGEPALSVSDLRLMFVEKQLPEGWQTWRKTRFDWVKNTTALTVAAGHEYLRLKKERA